MNNMFSNNSYGGYGTFTYPTQTDNFARTYGQSPYNNGVTQQMQMNPQPNGNFYYINGIEGAKAFLVSPNSTAMLLDSDSNHIFIKTANQQGQAILRQFEIKEISQNDITTKDNTNYVSVESFKELENKYIELEKDYNNFKNKYTEVKQDV